MVRKCLVLRCWYVIVSIILLSGRDVNGAALQHSEDGDAGEVDRLQLDERRLQAQLEEDIAEHKCASETGASSRAHEDTLARLNGKKLVYIGDSVTRYQYLELAYYLAHGRCPDLVSSGYGYIMNEKTFASWNEFYKNSSAAVTVSKAPIETQETCLCVRAGELVPGNALEHRHFTYQDVQGRKIEMIYLQYFREPFDEFTTLTDMAENLEPTDVLLNFGVWLRDTNSTCGENPEDWCTNIPDLCKYLDTDNPFKVWWLTSAPTSHNHIVADRLPPHLDVPARCQLDPGIVLNRTEALYALEPNAKLRSQNYWHWAHLHAEANHAFNTQFLGHLPLPDKSKGQRWGQSHLWRQMFS